LLTLHRFKSKFKVRTFSKLLTFLSLLLLSISLMAANKPADKNREAKAREFLNNQPLEFIENKGQFTDTDGKAADNVLFKTSFGNCDIYITDKGLSYVFVKTEVEQSEIPRAERIGNGRQKFGDRSSAFGEREKEENRKHSYYRLDMDLVGANIEKSNIIKEDESKQGHFNYFYPHCPEGIYDVKAYGKITIKNIYKGIDWVIYTNADSKDHPLKYDFVIHPGADYKDIKIKFLNAQSTSLADNDTKLKIQTIAGNIEEGNLYSYLMNEKLKIKNEKSEVATKYSISTDSIVSFNIAGFDSSKTLVIDPLVWATYYGGSGTDEIISICTDNSNNIYITGGTSSINFPIQQLTGGYWQSMNGSGDVILIKFNNHGIRQWATYYGGSDGETGRSICKDSQNNIFITGETLSSDFPCQQSSGAYWQPTNAGIINVFIVKFNDKGIRHWATYYGGNDHDFCKSIGADSQDNIYVVGSAESINFPTHQLTGAYWQNNNHGSGNVFILKFTNLGVRQWATYYGGSYYENVPVMCIDNQDNLFIVGRTYSPDFPTKQLIGAYWQSVISQENDLFILKFNSQGVREWSTFYGGKSYEYCSSMCFDSQNNFYITGYTMSLDFPIKQLAGAYWQANSGGMSDAFILKFNNQGIRQWATYYGGDSFDNGESINTDSNDNIYITGETQSTYFPVQQLSGEYWQDTNSGIAAVIMKFDNNGIRQWATQYGMGSSGCDLAVDNQNSVYFIGNLGWSGAYTTDYGSGAYYDDTWNDQMDAYILKLSSCINQKPIFIQSDRNNICSNDNTHITLTATGGIGDALKWYVDSCGQNYIGENLTITIPSPLQTTTYYARWESICDFSECDSINIIVKDCAQLFYFPNSFTPNGDGLNDVFKIETDNEFSVLKLIVFDRWGELLFESIDINKGWDGTYKGKEALFGIYVYKFTGTFKDTNEKIDKTARVTLIR